MHSDTDAPDKIDPNLPTVITPADGPSAPPPTGEIAPAPETEPEPVYCRHCGEEGPAGAEGNWLCSKCERYQDSQVCPTCHSVVSASVLPEDMVPAAHAPKKHKKGKG